MRVEGKPVEWVDHPNVAVIQRLILSSQFPQAEVVARAALKERPDAARIHFLLGVSVQKQKRYAEARAALEASLEAGQPFPERSQVDHFLGWANYYLGDLAKAKSHFQAHVGAVPTADDSWFGLGVVALEENRLSDAETALERAMDLAGDGLPGRPMRAKSLVRLGDVAMARDRFPDAASLYEEALELRPEQREVWTKLARAYERAGRPEDARAAERRGAQQAPDQGMGAGERPAGPQGSQEGSSPGPVKPTSGESSAKRQIRLSDVTASSGVDFTTTSGSLPSTQIIEVKGGGVALIDFDADGDEDLLFPNGATLDLPREGPGARLYENLGGMRFQRVSPDPPLRAWAFGPAVGDFDGDGDPDVIVACHGDLRFLRNTGNGRFVDASDALPPAARDPAAWNTSVSAADLDADGDLDLYVTRYLAFDPAKPPGPSLFKSVQVMSGPRGLEPQRDVLLRNDGGNFADASESSGVSACVPSYGLNSAIVDFTGDGWPDILVANDSQPDMLLENLGGMRFADVGRRMGIATNMEGTEQASMGIAIGDTNGDALPDAHVSVFSSDTNTLHESREGRFFDDRTAQRQVGIPSRRLCGWATAFADLDQDGDEDLLTVNGHVYPQATLALMDSEWKQPMLLMAREGSAFVPVDVAAAGVAGEFRDRAAVVADLDADGDLDVVITGLNQPVRVLRNDSPRAGDSIRIRLADATSVGNRDGLGSRIELASPTSRQVRWLAGGGPFQSNRSVVAHFGVGDEPGPWVARVTWPDGRTSEHPVPARGPHTLTRARAAD